MNWVDLAIILVILIFAIEGQRKGLLAQTLDILGFVISLILSLMFYSRAAGLFAKFFNLATIVANPIGFLAVWVIAETFYSAVSPSLFRRFSPLTPKNIDKLFGFLPAVGNALLFMAFILLFVVSLPIRPDIKKDIFDAKIGSFLVDKATVLERPLNNVFGPIAKQGLTFLTVRPEEKTSIPLEYTQNQLTVDSASERKMFELVNQERANAGIKPLVWNEALAQVGRNHSEDMFRRGYFSHYSPEGKDVGDRLQGAGIDFALAGENLALAPNVSRAHTGLINSEGHRRNILDPAFSSIGIGVIDGGVYGKMFTQVFTD